MPTDKKSIEVTILTSKKIKEKNPNITSPLILKYKSSLSLQDILTEVNKKLGLSGKEGFKLCAATGRGRELADNDELNSCISNGKCRLRFVQDVNDVCMGIMSTAPEKPRFKEGATCDYSLLSAVAELLDNSIEAVMRNGMDEKTIVICFNVIDKTFSIHDNGVGCEDPERLLRYGSEKAEVSDRYNPKCKTFDRYTCGMFSRYGVGSKKAGHSLGIIINIASKVKGSSLIHSTTDRDEEKWEAESFEQYIDDDDDEISKSYCKIDIDQFKTSLLTTGGSSSTLQGWEEVVNNLGMIYFMFLGDKMPGYHFVARKILKLLDDTCVHREGLNKIRMNTKPEVKRMEDDKRKLQEAMRGCKRAKTSPRLNISCKLIYPDATGLRQEVEASLSKSISCLNTLLSDAAVDCFPIHIELEKGNVDQQEGGSIAMGALFYFPNKDNKETIQYVDRFFGHSSGEDRRFLVFWMGRLLLADQFMPEFMKKDLAESKVPVKCLKRTFGILFLDRGIEPKSNKTSLSDNVNGQDSYLDQLRKALNDTKLVNAYHLWLRLCHRKYDDELTFEDEPTYCEKEGMFVHQKINYCGNEYKIGDYIELSEGDEFKRSKQPKNVKVGQVVKFLKATNDHEGCKGKVVCRVLEKNNRLEEDQRFEIPDWSMKRLSDEDFEARKEKNKCSIVHRVQFVNASKKFTAGDSTSPFQLKCLNHLGKSITVEPECDLIVTPEGGEDQRFKLRYTFSPFLPDADFLQKAGQYTVRAVQQQDSSNPLICDPFRFTIHPGDVKDVELQLEDRDLVKMEHGKESSFKVTLYDEYKNTIPPKVSHKPKIEVASGLVKLDVEHTFEGYAMQMKIVRVESEKCGRFSAKLVVMRDDGEGKETHFNIEISHGAAQSLQVEQSEGLELINRSVLPELTCVVQDGFGNRCTRVDDAILYLTSADLHFADCFISGKVNHGKHTFQTDKQVQSLYFLSPESGQKEATRCSVVRSWDLTKRNRDESGVELEETWNELIAKQLKPIGFLNPFHGFFCVGDWVEVLFKLKTGRNEYHPGRIESVCKEQGGNTWRIKYFKRSDSSRLLLPLPDASEVLDPMSLHRRIFVLHESLKDSLDPRALSDSVYFAPCDDCPRQLGASLDVFSHSRDQLLHRRVSMALKRSGSPCNFSICQGGRTERRLKQSMMLP
ncbi:hypothetical protein GUITHDRAFT_109200 [Guillardia theta CCMP2712]|uniref:SMCHD1 ribosomal S5 domain-containing protein n=2 Tax=Guillardia theta TaxID=55529 RepID=L1J9N5_GUITC|nr:hypothetical protein GUITHDRAFT_109200 [Guillardia theta CCMP2712]EKX44775.1 hypothetical protein GUITHDRAFT_109200 [Guillardia theta CCMP2712]|eukprot:XP_005831755.1 hypothetical protein GUITHDRAFT_109200 [Guillardia theta CCMP2712]